MGVEQVAYHEATVLGREDDHPGQALDYYASRGETPLRQPYPSDTPHPYGVPVRLTGRRAVARHRD
jgi:hypothetical protein